MKRLNKYRKRELKELWEAVVFAINYDEDYPEHENDPKNLLRKWRKRLDKAIKKK